MVSLNTSNITVNSDGSVSFSGLASGIDYQSIIDTTIEAKRANAVSIENRITSNTTKISAYAELKTLSENILGNLDNLRGSTSYFAEDVWDEKTAYFSSAAASTAASDYTPAAADNLISATVSNDATTGTHRIIVQQTAKAHQVRSGVVTDKTATLVSEGITAGTFEINGATITISATDTLLDLQDNINAADAGVTATIISVSDTEHYLVLAADETGTANQIDFGTATQTSFDLGLTDANSGAAAVANELQAARDAILDVDGITGITRSSNEIDDIIEGVTLSLFQAETDTELTLTVETDLNTIKTELIDLVDNYNALRAFYEDQRTSYDRDTTVDSDGDGDATNDEEFGAIAFDSTMRAVMDKLASVMISDNGSLQDGFQSLAQIGITVNEDYQLEIDDDTLDNKLLTNVEQVSKLFKFSFSSSDARVRYVSADTDTTQGTYYLNVAGTDVDGNITDATLSTSTGAGTVDDGSLTIDGQAVTATDATGAEGLKLVFLGGASAGAATDIEISFTRGLADQLYYYFDALTESSGRLDTLTTQLTERNEDLQDQVDVIDSRLEIMRGSLESKYIAMETALLELESLKQTISSYTDAQNSSSSN